VQRVKIEIGLKFNQSEQSLLNSKLIFFIMIGQISIQSQSLQSDTGCMGSDVAQWVMISRR